MKLAREALVSKDQIDEDFIGEEDWSVISTDLRSDRSLGQRSIVSSIIITDLRSILDAVLYLYLYVKQLMLISEIMNLKEKRN